MRLQPVEIHPDIEKRLREFDAYRYDETLQDVLSRQSATLAELSDHLTQTVLLWTNSTVLRQLISDSEALKRYLPTPSIECGQAGFLLQAESLNNSSILFRTFVSMVVGRPDQLLASLNKIQMAERSEHLSAALKLLRENEVRLLRNAVAHGVFLAKGSVLRYWDGNKRRRISYPELDELNFAVFKIVLAAWAASNSNHDAP